MTFFKTFHTLKVFSSWILVNFFSCHSFLWLVNFKSWVPLLLSFISEELMFWISLKFAYSSLKIFAPFQQQQLLFIRYGCFRGLLTFQCFMIVLKAKMLIFCLLLNAFSSNHWENCTKTQCSSFGFVLKPICS